MGARPRLLGRTASFPRPKPAVYKIRSGGSSWGAASGWEHWACSAAQVLVTSRKEVVQDTGKEKREPPLRRGCGGRRRRLAAGTGREPERARGQAVGQRAVQPAPPPGPQPPSARYTQPLGRSPGRRGTRAGEPERTGPFLRRLRPEGAPSGLSRRRLPRGAECPARAARREPGAAAAGPEGEERGRPWGYCPRARH